MPRHSEKHEKRQNKTLVQFALIFIFIIFWIPTPAAHAQVEIIINIPSPNSPFVSEWKENPAVGSVIVINRSGKTISVSYEVTVRHRRFGDVFHGKTLPQDLPTTGEHITNQTLKDFTWVDDTWNKDVEMFLVRTGRFPEGVYTVCIKVHHTPEEYAIECHDVEIVYPDPPQLLAPEDGATVTTPNPVFLWTPAVVPADFPVSYLLKICPIFEGQTPLRALTANVPQLETTLSATNLPYPLDGLPFKEGASYAWRVRAIDENNLPIASNRGYSEIFTFSFAGQQGPPPLPQVVQTDALVMTGLRLASRQIQTDALVMTGLRPVSRQIQTDALVMTGLRQASRQIQTDALVMTGLRQASRQIQTDALVMTGLRPVPRQIQTDALVMTGLRQASRQIQTDALMMTGLRQASGQIQTDALLMTGLRQASRQIQTDALVMTGLRPKSQTIQTAPLMITGLRGAKK